MIPLQKTFNTVVYCLLKQNKCSKITRYGDTICAYRGRQGLKCAVGCTIPDKLYLKEMEGCSLKKIAFAVQYSKNTDELRSNLSDPSYENNRLIRPRAEYTGPGMQEYIPIERRAQQIFDGTLGYHYIYYG